jgi:murein DD-endopeptidase MepM/ murein hydrolase activator NlpD
MAAFETRRRYRHIYVVDKTRFILFLTIIILLIAVLVLLYLNIRMAGKQYTVDQFSSEQLLMYFEVEIDTKVPWYYLAAVDKAEAVSESEISKDRSSSIALHLVGIEDVDELPLFLTSYKDDKSFFKKVKRQVKRFNDLQEIYSNKSFPILPDSEYAYEDGYGDPRSFGGERTHEGIDIMAETGVPIISVCNGHIEQIGWNELGGYRIGIRGEDNIYYYYAHLSHYEGSLEIGDKVRRRQLIGYVGDTGYGPEGTTGKFEPHLHFGMYYGKSKLKAFNPYPFLKAWEEIGDRY